jgi:hypothetical protein
LKSFEEKLSVCEDWTEIIDVLEMLQDISEPIDFFKVYLKKF